MKLRPVLETAAMSVASMFLFRFATDDLPPGYQARVALVVLLVVLVGSSAVFGFGIVAENKRQARGGPASQEWRLPDMQEATVRPASRRTMRVWVAIRMATSVAIGVGAVWVIANADGDAVAYVMGGVIFAIAAYFIVSALANWKKATPAGSVSDG